MREEDNEPGYFNININATVWADNIDHSEDVVREGILMLKELGWEIDSVVEHHVDRGGVQD